MRLILVLLASCFAIEAQAIVVDSVWRETSYSGGLEQPDMMGDSSSSSLLGAFDESFSETIVSPGVAEAGANVSQLSFVEIDYGSLVITMTANADNYASSLVGGAIADSLSWSQFYVEFTTTEHALFTVDLVVSSSLGLFFDAPGGGLVETSHFGSILICTVGGTCIADVVVEDLTDNGLAVADGVVDSEWLPPGHYSIELLAVSQTISRDVGSALGSAAFYGEVTLTPLPEPSASAGAAAGVAFLLMMARWKRRGVPTTDLLG